MHLKILDLLLLITVFLMVLFAVFLFTQKGNKRTSNCLLAGFLLCNAAPLVVTLLLRANPNWRMNAPIIFGWIYFFDFLMGPLVYFYTRALAFKDFRLKKQELLHAIPGLVFLAYLPIRYVYLHGAIRVEPSHSAIFLRWEQVIITVVVHILMIVYGILSVRVLKYYSVEIKKVVSSIERINLDWLRFILISFGIFWFAVIVHCIYFFFTKSPIPFLIVGTVVYLFIVVNIIIFKGWKQPQLFAGIEETPRYKNSPLTETDIREYCLLLERYMKEEKPFLVNSLTLDSLAEKISIPARYLSQVINERYNKNFFDFINSYRVEEAKDYLRMSYKKKMTVLQILYEVGFNSKAAFNRAFSKYTGMSPTEFKKTIS